MPLIAVNHHYYREKGTGRGIYPTTPSALMQEVSVIRKAGWRIGDETDILRFVSGELDTDDKVAIITFDDGFREQLGALKLLEQIDASAICYLPTVVLVDNAVLEVHKLQMIRAQLTDEEIGEALSNRFDFSTQFWDDELLRNQYRYDNQLARRIKYFLNFMIDPQEKQRWMSSLFESIFGDERAAAGTLYMSKSEIKQLSKKRLLGSHAHSHIPLATLCEDEVLRELQTAKDILSDLTGTQIIGVSYPFGGKSAVSETVYSLASTIGHEYGWTMERGISYIDETFDNMALKRIDVNDLANLLIDEASARTDFTQT
jgi:peptidoglycan/xylan/chitin deacetylase (PgdA/CDA1 family)